MGLDSDDIFFHKPRRVVGVTPDGDWAVKGSTDLLKHHFLPLIGKTTNLAETLRRREEPPSIEREAEKPSEIFLKSISKEVTSAQEVPYWFSNFASIDHCIYGMYCHYQHSILLWKQLEGVPALIRQQKFHGIVVFINQKEKMEKKNLNSLLPLYASLACLIPSPTLRYTLLIRVLDSRL
ncbi:hypothetical protein Bca52824_030996 [Brassica carinata]|uniref:Uncharacterized protein n=1 Tax=Brassica carinata TaxID=52824 RepID=A0A8X7S9D6_BRACI|nr:hypothetical protein Bca52824_030996 [Brassica carinata]